MAHNAEKTKCWIDSNSGIDFTADVAAVLGRASSDEGCLCADVTDAGCNDPGGKVNKWAKYKPTGSVKMGALTEAERQGSNYGIDCSNTLTGCFASSFADLLTRAKANNADWNKVSPTVYRIHDFDGYYHDTQVPYAPQQNVTGNASNATGDQPYVSLSIWHNIDLEGQTKLNTHIADLREALTRTGYTISDFKYALIYRDASTPSGTVYKVDIELTSGETIADLANKSLNVLFSPPSTYTAPAVYDCLFIAYAGDANSYWAGYLPNSYFQATIALFGIFDSSGNEIADDTVFEFPQSGGTRTFFFGGFNWEAIWPGKSQSNPEIRISLNPSQGDAQSSYSQVEMTVGAYNASSQAGYNLQTITVSVDDFTRRFKVKQACPVPARYIELCDSQGGNIGNTIYIGPRSAGYEHGFDLVANISWVRQSVQKEMADVGWVDTTDISVSPASGTTSNRQIFSGTIEVNTNLASGERYRVTYQSTDGTIAYSFYIET